MFPTVDIVLAIVLAVFLIKGYRHGFVLSVGQLIGGVIGFFMARNWSPWVAGFFMSLWPSHPGAVQFIAFVFVFLVVERIVGFLLSLVAKILKIITILPFISCLDSVLGGILALLEGLLLIGSSVYLALTLHLDGVLIIWMNQSFIARFSEQAFSYVLHLFV